MTEEDFPKIVSNFTNEFAKFDSMHCFNTGLEVPVFEINSYHALIQFFGYAKYINRFSGNVYLRGQHSMYDSMKPAIFRSVSSNASIIRRGHHIGKFIDACAEKIPLISDLNATVREPLLQHYGIGTRWIDLVDNVWIAIWFGTYTWHTRLYDREYKNVVPRESRPEDYMYIILMCSDGISEDAKVPGLYKGRNTYTIDLRKSAPSTFLRPHAQCAILMRSKQSQTVEHADLANYVVGIAKIKVSDGLAWIGANGLLSARSIFPPVNFDHGYGILIEQVPHNKGFIKDYGSIYSVTY